MVGNRLKEGLGLHALHAHQASLTHLHAWRPSMTALLRRLSTARLLIARLLGRFGASWHSHARHTCRSLLPAALLRSDESRKELNQQYDIAYQPHDTLS